MHSKRLSHGKTHLLIRCTCAPVLAVYQSTSPPAAATAATVAKSCKQLLGCMPKTWLGPARLKNIWLGFRHNTELQFDIVHCFTQFYPKTDLDRKELYQQYLVWTRTRLFAKYRLNVTAHHRIQFNAFTVSHLWHMIENARTVIRTPCI